MIDKYHNDHHSGVRPPDDGSPESISTSPESEFEQLFQSFFDAALLIDMSGGILHANARATQFLMFDRAELCGMDISDIVSGSDESLIKTLSENLKHERFTLMQAYCKRKDGSTFPSDIAVNKLHLKKACLVFFIRDITGRIDAEEKWKEKG